MEKVSIPINLDAFVLCEKSCDGESKIAPITQPNYVALRLDNSLIQHDILDSIDFHRVKPALQNPRLSDIGSNPPVFRNNRLGVHLHWSLPRYYKTASADADSRTASKATAGPTASATPSNTKDPSQPVFRSVPNRWLLVRHLKTSQPPQKLPSLQSWLIESDRLWNIADIPDDIDLETDVTPFVAYDNTSGDPNTTDVLQTQAEVFIGKKTLLSLPKDPKEVPRYLNEITVMNSSNPLFPDYALHNPNVFSTIDDFRYEDNQSLDGWSRLTEADADYFVIGWHSDQTKDPLFAPSTELLKDRLSGLFLDPGDDSANVTGVDRVILHGAMYSVKYNRTQKPHCVADDAAKNFGAGTSMEPISVGTTALDGIITFLEAHKDDAASFFKGPIGTLPQEILAISQLLYATEDSYDARVKASDLLVQNNYSQSNGGSAWVYAGKAGPGDPPATPSSVRVPPDNKPSEVENLQTLNNLQTKLDAATRRRASAQWDLFAEWWKFVSDRENRKPDRRVDYTTKMRQQGAEVASLNDFITATNKSILDISSPDKPGNYKKTSVAPFFLRKDPTICIAGLDSGWPVDYMDAVRIRFDHSLVSSDVVDKTFASLALPREPGLTKRFRSEIERAIPAELRMTAEKLLAESFTRPTPSIDEQRTTGFKSWNGNPFIPLFIEFELYYYHIPFEKWKVKLQSSPVGHDYKQVRYGISNVTPDDGKDFRIVTGRVPILPQPVFSLNASVKSVLDSASSVPLTDAQRGDLETNIGMLKFISAPLSGITNHLLTRSDGAHVKPCVRVQGEFSTPLVAAVEAGSVRDVDQKDRLEGKELTEILGLIGDQSALTPYGNLMNFGNDYPHPPFKPVTHGQLAFTKLSIVDKFGQAICVPEPRPQPRVKPLVPPSIHPCLSDYLQPARLGDHFDTVFPEPDLAPTKWPVCRFMQLTPSINQESRINASFVLPRWNGSAYDRWEEASDFEQPIFGWIVVNYANSGLQFFLPNGIFYREVRIGGPLGTNAGAKWLPFDPPATANAPSSSSTAQLDQLIQLLTNPSDTSGSYLLGFAKMINESIKNMPYPPSDYAAYANAIVGKPLALVNVGWSLELAAPAIKYQNTLGRAPDKSDQPTEPSDYTFPFKIGDFDRPFDGVVGFYHARNNTNDPLNGKTDWSELLSYFVPDPLTSPGRKISPITTDNFLPLKPWFVDPLQSQSTDILRQRAAQYHVTTMLVDPYTPLHAYSPILPTKSLQLPAWTIQSAFKRMSAFFRLGPYLLTKDVPTAYNADAPLHADTWATPKEQAAAAAAGLANTATAAIRLPLAGKKGLWNWLQPYADPTTDEVEPRFNSLDVGEEDTNLRHDPAPYTFVEGYLQLARPLIKEDLSLLS